MFRTSNMDHHDFFAFASGQLPFPTLQTSLHPLQHTQNENTDTYEQFEGSKLPLDPHQKRRDTHREVERRRRANINEGIDALGAIVPGEGRGSSKGRILNRTIQYIQELKQEQIDQLEKFALEKMVYEASYLLLFM